jgi:hypothetical protein
MIRKICISILLCFFSLSTFAATDIVSRYLAPVHTGAPMCDTHASYSYQSTFCATFPPAAICNCQLHTTDPNYCSSMTNIYKAMIKTYGSLAGACKMQNVTTPDECVADWNCYWDGGKPTNLPPSDTRLCDGNGIACTTDPRPPGV